MMMVLLGRVYLGVTVYQVGVLYGLEQKQGLMIHFILSCHEKRHDAYLKALK